MKVGDGVHTVPFARPLGLAVPASTRHGPGDCFWGVGKAGPPFRGLLPRTPKVCVSCAMPAARLVVRVLALDERKARSIELRT